MESNQELPLSQVIQGVADLSPDAILICDAASVAGGEPRILYVNPAYTAITQYEQADVLGKSPKLLHGAGTSEVTRQEIRRALKAKQAIVVEILNYKKDGSPFSVELHIAPIFDSQGQCKYWLSVQRDLTHRRRHEHELQVRNQVMESLTDAVALVDATQSHYPIIYTNEVFSRLTGYTSSEALGRNCIFLQGKDTDPEAIELMRSAIREERQVTLELLNYRRDGSTFWNLLTISPMRSSSGKTVQFIGVIRDVTELKTRERQMVIAQRVKSLGELAGGVAHDFNNLLASILGSAQLLGDFPGLGERERTLVKAIVDASQRGAVQVKRLLALSRTPMLKVGLVDVRLVVDQLRQLLVPILPESIELRVDLSEDASWIHAEPVQLESALLNLIINARDAMPQGGVIVLKSRRWIHEQRMWVTVSVQDNGCGMDPLTATQVFDPFFTTKPVGQGSGLGLAMVHSFVSQVRGRVEVTTNPGGGSRFDLHFLAGPVTAEAAAEKDVAPAAVVTRPLTVLLVEDDPVVRLTSKAMLERLGHTVLDCESGDEALEVLRSAQLLDLLFTDMVMPGRLNGRELAEYSAQIRPSLPVLLTSGWLDSDNSQLNTHGRALAMLNKPFSMDDLSLALGHVISRTI